MIQTERFSFAGRDVMAEKVKNPWMAAIKSRIVLVSALTLLIVGIGCGARAIQCGGTDGTAAAASQKAVEEPRPTVTCLGRLEPRGEVVRLNAPTSSQESLIRELKCEEGGVVKKGQVLAILDSEERLRATVEQARAQVAVAQAQLDLTRAGAKKGQIEAQRFEVKRLEAALAGKIAAQKAIVARLDSVHKQALVDYGRYQYLSGEMAVSKFDFDQKKLELETALQNLNEAKAILAETESAQAAQIKSAQATLVQIAEVRSVDVEAAQASLSHARAGFLQAQAALEQAYIRSPLDGKILKIYTRPGEKIGDSGFADAGCTQTMMAMAEVYQSDVNKIAPGQAVVLTVDALPGATLHGVVKCIGQEVRRQNVINTDPSANIDERVVEVRVQLDKGSSAKVANLSNSQVTATIKL